MKTYKHLLYFILILLPLASGCEQKSIETWGDDITVIASCVQTKTVNDGLATRWQDSDKLSVFAEASAGYSNSLFNYTGNESFKGKLPPLAETKPMYAVYPYTSKWKSPKTISVNASNRLTQTGNGSLAHLAGPGFPLYGKSSGSRTPSFPMAQLLAVASFNITNGEDKPITVKSIEFTAPVPVSGEFIIDITGDAPVYVPEKDRSSGTVTLNVNGGTEIVCGETASFYMGMVPFNTTGNFNISVKAECGGVEVVSSKKIEEKTIAIAAGAITGLNYTFTVPAEEGTTPGDVEAFLGTFNLVNEDMDSFMAAADTVYTDSNWHKPASATYAVGVSIVTYYRNGSGGDNSEIVPPPTDAIAYDRPNPVPISVAGHNGEIVTVTISGDGKYAQEIYTETATVSENVVEIYNLIPNRTYHYVVSNSSGEICKGYFITEGRRRIMKVSDVVSADNGNNLRDLGGLRTLDGRSLKYGKVFRGTNIDGLSSAEKDYMINVMNIGLDVDMRVKKDAKDRTRQESKRVLDPEKVDFSDIGFASFIDIKDPEKMRPTMLAILETLQSGKAVYVHCFAGADRTGCVCMLLEALCGVSEKDCTIDYELTAFSCIGPRPRIVYNSGFVGYLHPYLWDHFDGQTFQENAKKFLLYCGLTAEQISALQDALIE